MTVVGAGVIGVEYASMFGALGVKVTVVDQRDRTLDFLDGEIGEAFQYLLRRANVTFRFREKVEAIESVDGRARIKLASGKEIVSETVLYAVGRQGATDELGIEKTGLEADKRGRLTVDDNFRTSVPHIFAVGDVAGGGLAATAMEQGRIAALHAFDQPVTTLHSLAPTGIYAIPEIGMVGSTEEQLTDSSRPYVTGIARWNELARGLMTGDEDGMLKMLVDPQDRCVLGVHVIGTGATELVHIGQAVMAQGPGGLDFLVTAVFNYPTFAESYKVAALDAANRIRGMTAAPRLRVELEDDPAELDVVAGLEARAPRARRSRPCGAAGARRARAPRRSPCRGGRSGGRPPRRSRGTRRRRRARPRTRARAAGRKTWNSATSSSPAASSATGSAAGTRRSSSRASSSRPWRVALEVTSTGTSSPTRSRHRRGGVRGRARASTRSALESASTRGSAASRGSCSASSRSITAWLASGSEPSSGARSSTCTSSRVRSTWARKSWPSPAPSLAPSISPGMSATHELAVVGLERAEHRLERRERVGGDLRLRARHAREQRRLARVGQADEPDVGEQLEVQLDGALVARAGRARPAAAPAARTT